MKRLASAVLTIVVVAAPGRLTCFSGGANQDGLQPPLQGFLGEARSREVCQNVGRAARRREPTSLAGL